MVTSESILSPQFDYFRNLPSLYSPVTQVTFEDLRNDIIADLQAFIPTWTADTDDPLYKASEYFAYREKALVERIIGLLRLDQYIITATGDTGLDRLVGFQGTR